MELLAVLLLAAIAGVNGGGTVVNLTVSPQTVMPDATINIACTVQPGSSGVPTIHFRKSYGSFTSTNSWDVSANEDLSDTITNNDANAMRFNVLPPSSNTTVGAPLVYTLVIYNAKNEDSGNYTCWSGTSNRTVLVNVPTEPNNVTLYLNGMPVGANEKRYVRLNAKYELKCIVSGANPYPNVTLSSGSSIPGPVTYVWNYNRTSGIFGKVTSQTTATVMGWTADVSYIGKPLVCNGGVQNQKAVTTSFIPVTNHTEPMFSCNDTAYLAGSQSTLFINCSVYSEPSNLVNAFVHWHTDLKNLSITGDLVNRDRAVALTDDGHYTLMITPPATPTDHWWKMSLRITSVRSLTKPVDGTIFSFVAVNSAGTAKHTVLVNVASGPVSGVARLCMTMYLSGLVALLTTVVMAVIRP
jgi:hypothetical protein